MLLTTPIRQARFQALAVTVWESYLQTPWLLNFHLVSLEHMVIAPKAHSRDWVLGQDGFLTVILTALPFLMGALVLLAVDLFSLPFGEYRSPLLPSGTIPGIRTDQIMLNPKGDAIWLSLDPPH